MRKKNLLFLQSGGPTAVINASLYGFLKAASQNDSIGEIYGSKYGIEGVLNGDFLNFKDVREEDIALLPQTPDMFLGSSRKNLSNDFSNSDYSKILSVLRRFDIDGVFINGGNDSMLTASRLFEFFKMKGERINVLGIPKTIDNDLFGFDHTLGYGSAALHVLSSVKCVAIDGLSYKEGKIQIIETMGRDTGWLAAASDLLPSPYHPDFILIPELSFDVEEFYKDLKTVYETKHRALIVLSEGVNPCIPEEKDPFGHENLEGAGNHWARLIKEKLGYKSRVTILSSPMRSDPVLASGTDVDEAIKTGEAAFNYFLSGLEGVMPSFKRVSNNPYTIAYSPIPLKEVGGAIRYMPKEFLKDYRQMDPSFLEYLKPLLSDRELKKDSFGLFLSSKSYL